MHEHSMKLLTDVNIVQQAYARLTHLQYMYYIVNSYTKMATIQTKQYVDLRVGDCLSFMLWDFAISLELLSDEF